MFRPWFTLLLLTGCAASPEQWFSGGIVFGVVSVTIIHRSPFDAVYSMASGRDCSIVRLDRGETYCRPEEPPPEPPRFCTRSLARVDCWAEPARTDPSQPQVADGPAVLTETQEANRRRRWPE